MSASKHPRDYTPEDHLAKHERVLRMLEHDYTYPLEFQYLGYSFTCLKGTYPNFSGGKEYVQHLPLQPKPGGNAILEIGSGTGCVSCIIYLTRKELVSYILGTDIAQHAVENTKLNFQRYGVPGDCINSDLFNDIPKDKQFDLMFWNPPYAWVQLKNEPTEADLTMVDPGYRAIGRYIKEAGDWLTSGGKAVLLFSPTTGNWEVLQELAKEHGKALKQFHEEVEGSELISWKIVRAYEIIDA